MQLINVLTRSHNRRELAKCIASINLQKYKKLHLIVSVDTEEDEAWALLKASGLSHEIIHTVNNGIPYNWNLYCNELKERVADGWFFYLDDDDWISRAESLQAIAAHLDDPNVGVICQYYRGRLAKPVRMATRPDRTVDPASIIIGKIGGSAIFLHHSQKNVADWQGHKAADYTFIKAVAEKLPLKFIPIPVVQAGNGGRHGS